MVTLTRRVFGAGALASGLAVGTRPASAILSVRSTIASALFDERAAIDSNASTVSPIDEPRLLAMSSRSSRTPFACSESSS